MAKRYTDYGSKRKFYNNYRSEGTGAEGRVSMPAPEDIPALELDYNLRQASLTDYMNLRPINLSPRERVPRDAYSEISRRFTDSPEYRSGAGISQSLAGGLTTFGNFTTLNGKEVIALLDPYANPSFQKKRLENAYRLDPIVRRGINLIAKFVLGQKTKTIVSTITEFIDTSTTESSPAEQIDALTQQQHQLNPTGSSNAILQPEDLQSLIPIPTAGKPQPKEGMLSDKEKDQLKDQIEKVNRRVKFHQKLKGALVQSCVGGRSCLLTEGRDPNDKLPNDMKLLNWRKLGRVFIDPRTWQLEAIEYADFPSDKPLMAEDIIYLPLQDFHVSPDTMFYGLSLEEPIVDISEANRLIDQQDMKEANKSLWASHGALRVPPNLTAEQMDRILANFQPGTWNAFSQDVIVETYELAVHLDQLSEERRANDIRILQALGLPSVLVNFEDMANRSTNVTSLHAWRETDLYDYRTWLNDQLEPQWYDKLSEIILPDKDWPTMKMKAQMDFEDIAFEGLKEMVEALLPLYQANVITKRKVLKSLNFDDEIQYLDSQDAIEMALRMQQLQIKQQELRRQQNIINLPNFDQARTDVGGNGKQITDQQTPRVPAGKHDVGQTLKTSSEQNTMSYMDRRINEAIEQANADRNRINERHAMQMQLYQKKMEIMQKIERNLQEEGANNL